MVAARWKQHVYVMKYLRNKIPFVRSDNSAENGFKKLQLAVQLVAQFYFSGLDNINLSFLLLIYPPPQIERIELM